MIFEPILIGLHHPRPDLIWKTAEKLKCKSWTTGDVHIKARGYKGLHERFTANAEWENMFNLNLQAEDINSAENCRS